MEAFKKLNAEYKKACVNQTKERLNGLVNEFIEDDTIDGVYKDKIISMIVGLITLNKS